MAILPSKDRRYLLEREVPFEEVIAGSAKGLIFPEWKLPDGLFDQEKTSVLIMLPGGYPDLAPDMFFSFPWIKLSKTRGYARCADQPFQFNNIQWQRWSRHNQEWRRGVDGIWTMLKRVEHALEVAQ